MSWINVRVTDSMWSLEVREEMLRIVEWWKGKTLEDRCQATLPKKGLKSVWNEYSVGNGNMTSGDGHIMLDF